MNLDYPYIRAWGRYMESSLEYITGEIERAKVTNAPQNAIYEIMSIEGRTGKWRTVDDVQSFSLRYKLLNIAERLL